MKPTRRIPALLLAMAALCTLTLTGCKKEAPAPADQVALSIYDMITKDDASSLVELFGYADEAEARRDMGLEGSIYDRMAEGMVSQISEMGITVSNEEMQAFINAYVSMFKEVEFTAKVKEADEKAGKAVVTCTISTFDPEDLTQAVTGAMTNIDPSVLESNDLDKIFSAMLSAMADAISDMEPTGETADFDVDFELQKTEINGKTKEVWAPRTPPSSAAKLPPRLWESELTQPVRPPAASRRDFFCLFKGRLRNLKFYREISPEKFTNE